MLETIIGALVAGVPFLCLGVIFLKRRKASRFTFLLMTTAGVGAVPLTLWLAEALVDLIPSPDAKGWVGVFFLTACVCLVFAIIIDWKDGRIDYPLVGLLAASVIAGAVAHGGAGWAYVTKHHESSAKPITQVVE
ncbi:hypothetical protein ACIBKY_51530 [Nonomuraea sp. NPDC050394]|uniref:hypothetical protein n=1 Tax=Nonomuraea sp. NPDC050394 TaxID=3364363 RepID=UPI003787427C